MNELDLLKKDWKKNENSFKQVTDNDIYKMLHKKSSSIIKWILIMSLFEVAFWVFISVAFNGDDFLNKKHLTFIIPYTKIIGYINYGIITCFIYIFYTNYRKISTVSSTHILMHSILKTRKTVRYYVGYNISLFVLGTAFLLATIISIDPMYAKIANNPLALVKFSFICVVFLIIGTIVVWLFYKLLYGILLRKLHANYKELKKIDL